MKKITAIVAMVLCIVLMSSTICMAARSVTLYAEGGKTMTTTPDKVQAQLNVGWYTEPVERLYTANGQSKLFVRSKVQAQLNVGWYRLSEYIILNAKKVKTAQGYSKAIIYIEDMAEAYKSKLTTNDASNLNQARADICSEWYASTGWKTPVAFSSSFVKNGEIAVYARNITGRNVKKFDVSFSLYNANGGYLGKTTQTVVMYGDDTKNAGLLMVGSWSGYGTWAKTASIRNIAISNVVFED